MAMFELDATEFERLEQAIAEYEGKAGNIINEVLHGEGAEMIEQKIMNLLPASGRSWKGKRAAASSTQPFRHDGGTLQVTVRTKTAYNYLYFPDDGSNTIRHAGNQQFMLGGAEDAASEIIDRCIARLTEEF